MPEKGRHGRALRIAIGLICAPLIGFGALLFVATLLVRLFGGPVAPPAGMAWEGFKTWTESGGWFWESLLQATAWIAVPLLAIWGVNRWTRP